MCKLNVMMIINKFLFILLKLLINNNFLSKFQLHMCTFPYADGPASQCGALPPRRSLTGAVRKHYKLSGNDRHSDSRQTYKMEMGA